MEESKRERVGGGKEVLSPSPPNPVPSPFFLAYFSLRFPNYLKACYRLTTYIPSFSTFYGIQIEGQALLITFWCFVIDQ